MNFLIRVFIFFLGSIIGSFVNVVIWRLPRQQKLTGRSHCVFCNHILGPLELVPLLSFLFLGGRCKFCKAKISPRYFVIEAITGLFFVWAFLLLRPQTAYDFLILFKWLLIIAVCIITFVVDLEHYIILDSVIFPAAGVIIIFNIAADVLNHNHLFSSHSITVLGLAGALAAALPFYLIWYASKWFLNQTGLWMGFGDVKLGLFLGLALGWPLVFVALMLAIILGGIVSTFLLLLSSKTLKSQVPFGTFLTLGAVFALFYGQHLLAWYLSILGF